MSRDLSKEYNSLTKREREVFHCLLDSQAAKLSDIAMRIVLSVAGVKVRAGKVYKKFGVKNRVELLVKTYGCTIHTTKENNL